MHPSGCSESAILLTARVSRLAFFLMKVFVEPLSLNEKISEKIRNKCHYFVHCVWFLDPENAKDPFKFEKIWDYQANILYCDWRCVPRQSILQENDIPLLHRAACKEFVSPVQFHCRKPSETRASATESSKRSTQT